VPGIAATDNLVSVHLLEKKKLTENLGLAPRSLLLYLSFSFLSVFPSHFWHFK
jgi:hypothetical protein